MTGQAGYAQRAGYYATEIGGVPEPALLAGLLRPGMTVAGPGPGGLAEILGARQSQGLK
jgi:hypothetical protein